jgi:hypothetical protein
MMSLQQDKAEILNGRPWTSSGPPVGLYHPVFDRFCEYFTEPTPEYKTASSASIDDSVPSIDDVFSFMRASSEFYEAESKGSRVDGEPPIGRTEAILPTLERLLGVNLHRIRNADGTEPDATATAKMPAGHDGRLTIIELKLESGVGGDGKTQAQQSYARTCSLPDVRLMLFTFRIATYMSCAV